MGVPVERLWSEAITRSITEARPTRDRVDLTSSTSVEVLASESIYLAALLLRPELAGNDRGHGFLVSAPCANIVILHELDASGRSRHVLHPMLALSEKIFSDQKISSGGQPGTRLSPKVWWIRGSECESIGTFTATRIGGGLPQPIMSTELLAKVGDLLGLDPVDMTRQVSKPWWRFW